MTVTITRPAKEIFDAFSCHGVYSFSKDFWFDGDNTKHTFELPTGWMPVQVFVDGLLKAPGGSKDYIVKNDGLGNYSVVFGGDVPLAPPLVRIAIFCTRV
jgi:hypothetical protein